jgi:hypothetical protein
MVWVGPEQQGSAENGNASFGLVWLAWCGATWLGKHRHSSEEEAWQGPVGLAGVAG